jgi:hypothetical protein
MSGDSRRTVVLVHRNKWAFKSFIAYFEGKGFEAAAYEFPSAFYDEWRDRIRSHVRLEREWPIFVIGKQFGSMSMTGDDLVDSLQTMKVPLDRIVRISTEETNAKHCVFLDINDFQSSWDHLARVIEQRTAST